MEAAFLLPEVAHRLPALPSDNKGIFGGIEGPVRGKHRGRGMARTVTPLSDIRCRQAKYNKNGSGNKLFDGGGLFLDLLPSGAKKWRMKYRRANGKENLLTFGDYPAYSLAQARLARQAAKDQLTQGQDPAIEREISKQATIQAQGDTFEAIATEWLAMKKSGWSPGYYERVRNALKANVYPGVGALPVDRLSGLLILNIIKQVEKRGAIEMAGRVLDAINMVLNYACGTGRIKANPADGLKSFLADRPPVKHFPHVDATKIPEMLQRIEHYQGRPETIFATKLMIHTFPRTTELIWAEWPEFDLDGAVWAIPSARMKGRIMAKQNGDVHLVPLSTQMVDMLRDLKSINGRYRFLLPGQRNPATRPISSETINKALKIMGYEGEQTGHGFRGLASTIMNDSGLFRAVAIDTQLSHKKKDKVEAAYNHAEYFIERVKLMQWWADYLQERRESYEHQGAS